MSDEDLKHICREWQSRLGLAHWRIDVRTVRGVEIDDACGQVDFKPDKECALIRIKSPDDYHGYYPQDIEQTIVHELLHIVFDTVSGVDGIFYEQAIDRTARAFVRLKRQEREVAA